MIRLVLAMILALAAGAAAVAAEDDLRVYSGRVEKDIFTAGGNVDVDAEVKGDVFAAGGTVRLAGAVSDDVFLAGGRVNLTSAVGGDVHLGGGLITVTGDVGDSLIAGGGSVNLDGTVAGKVILAGGQIDIGHNAVIGGQALLTGGQVVHHGRINGNLKASGNRVTIMGTVAGDVEVSARRLILGPEAVVGGSILFKGPEAPEISAGAQVGGRIDHRRQMDFSVSKPAVAGLAATAAVMPYFFTLIIGAAVLLLAPGYAQRLTARLRDQLLPSFGVGVLLVFGVPVLLLALIATIIGIPLAILGFSVYMVLLMMGLPLGVLAISGRWSMRPGIPVSRAKAVGIYALTLLGVFVIALVPFLGFLALWVIWSAGIGGGLMALRAPRPIVGGGT